MENRKAFDYAISFIRGNITISLIAVTILMILSLMKQTGGSAGVLFVIVYSILATSIQVYVAKSAYEADSSQDMSSRAEKSKLSSLLFEHIGIATGSSLGLLILMSALLIPFSYMFAQSAGEELMREVMEKGITDDFIIFLQSWKAQKIILSLMSILAIVSYIMPAVMGKSYMSDSFSQAFGRVFLIFSPSLWKSSFNKNYFTLIVIWSIVVSIAFLLIMEMSKILYLLPIVLIASYTVSLYNGILYIFSLSTLSE
jgi:hypothetical protein